ncbi:DUF817 family protein, partial [Acinetobacter baumannii]|uniref:DUF817 family protein n=1 Tax=Acinetobacter baumannii TaxID=470 RepID=UPI001FABFE5B
IMAMVMEIFLTHPAIASWQYPQPAVFKILTVPLFAGFMYSAVGSFFARSIRLLQVSFEKLPGLDYVQMAIQRLIGFGKKEEFKEILAILRRQNPDRIRVL